MKPRPQAEVEADLKKLNHEWMHAAGFFVGICPEPACIYLGAQE